MPTDPADLVLFVKNSFLCVAVPGLLSSVRKHGSLRPIILLYMQYTCIYMHTYMGDSCTCIVAPGLVTREFYSPEIESTGPQ